MAPDFERLGTFTSESYATSCLRFSPPEGLRPTSVWHVVHATRPATSVVSKSSFCTLENVGSRFGVGPATFDRLSSQAARANPDTSSATRTRVRIGLPPDLLSRSAGGG